MTAGSATCGKCGAVVTAGARFCMSCGFDVSGAQGEVATRMVATATQQLKHGLIEALRSATLGEYEVMAELGVGGMATVFLAHDIHLDRKVAIKVMSPQLVAGEEMVERFKLEARTAAGLSHPHIIPIYAVKEQNELLFFVMKFVEGRPLDSIIKKEAPLPVPMVRQIVARVADALGYAHRKGVVHRDIKPANIMIDTEGLPIVTDFGIAKVADKQGLTMTGATIGTPTYMSPEQCNAQPITGASDQYSLGVLAYEMLTGRAPFDGESVMTIMFKHVHEAPRDLRSVSGECPPDLSQAVMRMVTKDPQGRFQHMEQVVKAVAAPTLSFDDPMRTKLIEYAMQGENRTVLQRVSTPRSPFPGSGSRPRTPGSTGPRTGTTTRPSQEPTEVMPSAERAATKRRRGLALAAVGLAVVGLGAALAVLQPWSSEAPTTGNPLAQGPPPEPADPTGNGGAQPVPAVIDSQRTDPPPDTQPVRRPPVQRPQAATGPAPVQSVDFVDPPRALGVREERTLQLTVRDANGQAPSAPEIAWESSDPRVVSVQSDGTVRGVAPGSATIAATVGGVRGAVRISVNADRVASVAVAPRQLTLEAGTTGELTAAVSGDRTPSLDRQALWSSDNVRVATVDAGGRVTAVAPGSATITATVDEQRGTAAVTVEPRPLTRDELRAQAISTVQAYARAIEGRDSAQIRALRPTLTASQLRDLLANLRQMEELRVTLNVGDVPIVGDEATLSVTGDWRFRASGRSQDLQINESWRLRRVGDEWVIAEIRQVN